MTLNSTILGTHMYKLSINTTYIEPNEENKTILSQFMFMETVHPDLGEVNVHNQKSISHFFCNTVNRQARSSLYKDTTSTTEGTKRLTGSNRGERVCVPRIVLNTPSTKWPFILQRQKYPIRLCYAITISKSKGQTLDKVGLYQPKPDFLHWQFYVAISRVTLRRGLKILALDEAGEPTMETRNIVYREVLDHLQRSVNMYTSVYNYSHSCTIDLHPLSIQLFNVFSCSFLFQDLLHTSKVIFFDHPYVACWWHIQQCRGATRLQGCSHSRTARPRILFIRLVNVLSYTFAFQDLFYTGRVRS